MELIKSKARGWRRRHEGPEPPDPVALQLQLATEENDRLQESVRSLTSDLNTLKDSHLALEGKADDLDHKLQLERRRLSWQKHFYERKIVEIVVGVGRDPSEFLANLSTSFYEETILQLVAEQERKEGELRQVKDSFEEQFRRLQETHEFALNEIVESNLAEVENLRTAHEELIRDLVKGCEEGLFKELKEEFLVDAQTNTDLVTNTNGKGIWAQFQSLSTERKGIIVACVCIVCIGTAGWASWGFITWVWPRLIIFAESVLSNPQTLSTWTTFLLECLNSPQFQTFVVLWEQGQPLGACVKPFLNSALLLSALQMTPNLLKSLKNRRNKTQTDNNSMVEN